MANHGEDYSEYQDQNLHQQSPHYPRGQVTAGRHKISIINTELKGKFATRKEEYIASQDTETTPLPKYVLGPN